MANPLGGGIARTVFKALKAAKMVKPATLVKVTPGTRTNGNLSAGTNPTTVSYTASGLVSDYTAREIDGTLIIAGDRRITLFGASLASGIVPAPNDQITIEGTTFTIVGPVNRDAAGACFICNGRA